MLTAELVCIAPVAREEQVCETCGFMHENRWMMTAEGVEVPDTHLFLGRPTRLCLHGKGLE